MQARYSTSEIIKFAAEKGVEITSWQFERWRKAGLIPNARIVHDRFGGTRSDYPEEAVDHILAVNRLQATDGRLNHILAMLFFEGFYVPPPALKRAIQNGLITPLLKLRKRGESKIDTAERLAKHAEKGRLKQTTSRRARKRIKDLNEWHSLLTTFYRLLYGDPVLFENWDFGEKDQTLTSLMVHALALRRASTDSIGDAKPWLTDPADSFNQMSESKMLSIAAMEKSLINATESDFNLARSDSEALFGMMPVVARVFEANFGQGAFGFGLFSEITDIPLAYRILAFLFCLHARKNGLEPNIDLVVPTIQGVHDRIITNNLASTTI